MSGRAQGLSGARRPRGIVRINGTVADFLSFHVEQKTWFAANTWHVEMQCWDQPQGFDVDFFAGSVGTEIEILIGQLGSGQRVYDQPSGLTSLVLGAVDDIDLSLNSGRLTLSGRDYTAKLIDTKSANKWPDHVSSWIVTELAAEVGLSANVTPTTQPSGEYYTHDYTRVSRSTPMWDTVKFLAEQEGFDAYVTGTTLYFGPPQADLDVDPFPVLVQRQPDGTILSTAKRIDLRRSETVAGDITVTVLSHGIHRGKGVKATASRAGKSGAKSGGQNYVLRPPGITQAQAQQLANNTLLELTRREKTGEMTFEGDPAMTVQRRVKLTGTGTDFDLDYYVARLNHSFDRERGYEMEMSIKNHPTFSTIEGS